MKKFLCLALVAATAACTIVRDVSPLSSAPANKRACVVDSPDTRQSFRDSLTNALKSHAYTVEIISSVSAAKPDKCSLVMTYVGKWTWDLMLYMSYADIKAFTPDGKQVGHALYDATRGSGRVFEKFGDADIRIKKLVDDLLK